MKGLITCFLFALLLSSCSTPSLSPWHTVSLESDFTASKERQFQSLDDYLQLEDVLFSELAEKINKEVATGGDHAMSRYSDGSMSDPLIRQPNWNRTFELEPETVRGGVLMLHGLTDSPYTFRSLAQSLVDSGYHVVGLRLPGHGTAPSGLNSLKWQDAAAAIRVALRHLGDAVDDKPIHLFGYSFGAPLAVNGALDAMEQDDLPDPESIVLLSPAIGVTGAARFAGFVDSVLSIPGLRARRWNRVIPEFDPYKYNSFTFNAGSQVHKLTRHVARRIEKRRKQNPENVLPPTLVFGSTVDATVSIQSLVDRLLSMVSVGDVSVGKHEFVLFDINRVTATSELLISNPGPFTARTMARSDLPFTLSLVTNTQPDSLEVEVRRKPPNTASVVEVTPLNLAWPEGVFSLSHLALPIPTDDPLYGQVKPENRSDLFLGNSNFVGETGMLVFPASWLMRLRYNPFYTYVEKRALGWITTIDTVDRLVPN
ncbi:MAG: alpha/beta hydrolase [Granulosicoccus sp.]